MGKEQNESPKTVGAFSKVLNFFWIVLFGLWATIIQTVGAVIFLVTILGIPNGLALFHTLKILWHPFGRKVALHYGAHPFLNTIWLIFFGWIHAVLLYIAGALFCVLIVTIPIGLQVFKLAKAYWAPHGVELYVE